MKKVYFLAIYGLDFGGGIPCGGDGKSAGVRGGLPYNFFCMRLAGIRLTSRAKIE